jgi:hypothetical protein
VIRSGAALSGVAPLAAAIGLLGGCPDPRCEERTELVAMDAWVLVAPADDPFGPPADAALCTEADIRMEPFGVGGPVALDVDTGGGCGWATLVQPLQHDVAAGEDVNVRVFYFSQTRFPAAEAEIAIGFGDEVFWSERVPIPTSSDVTPRAPLPAAAPIAAGTPTYFHVGNHGDNSWNLLELSRTRTVFCP